MSEYQYYEFRAIDRALSKEEQAELRKLSTRAEIDARSFTNTYHYGDFKGDPDELIAKYFDAFIYVSNWGSYQLTFRFPSASLDHDILEEYAGGCLTVRHLSSSRKTGGFVVLNLERNDDGGGGWEEGEEWMPELIELRDEILRGDLRPLYLGWLAGAEHADEDYELLDDEAVEPPVPPGLAELTSAQETLARFLQIDQNLIAAASKASTVKLKGKPVQEDVGAWVSRLGAAEKEALLLRLLEGEAHHAILGELRSRFRTSAPPLKDTKPRRTLAQLREIRDGIEAERKRAEAEKQAAEKARKSREAAYARARRIDALLGREAEAWKKVENLIRLTQPKLYDEAVEILGDLRELASREGKAADFDTRLRALRETHRRKTGLMERLKKQGIVS